MVLGSSLERATRLEGISREVEELNLV